MTRARKSCTVSKCPAVHGTTMYNYSRGPRGYRNNMKLRFRTWAVGALWLFAVATGNATTLAGSNTFVDLAWDLSGPASVGCTQILADATGDATRSTRIVIYGSMNCQALGGGLPMTGVAFVDADGLFNIAFNFSSFHITCARLRQASGFCTMYTLTGTNLGNVAVTLRQ